MISWGITVVILAVLYYLAVLIYHNPEYLMTIFKTFLVIVLIVFVTFVIHSWVSELLNNINNQIRRNRK